MSLMTIDPVAGGVLKLKALLPELTAFAKKEMIKILEFQDAQGCSIIYGLPGGLYVDAPQGADVKGFYIEAGVPRVMYTTYGYEDQGQYDMELTSTMATDHIAMLQQKLEEASEQRRKRRAIQESELEALEREQLAKLKEKYPDA